MQELGYDKVFQRVGSEPTGGPFNSVPAVVETPTHTGNPFVNAGAIATTSLISGGNEDEKCNKILDSYSRVAGEKLVLIDEAYKSEAATKCRFRRKAPSPSLSPRFVPGQQPTQKQTVHSTCSSLELGSSSPAWARLAHRTTTDRGPTWYV
jgi:hypothetical protein